MTDAGRRAALRSALVVTLVALGARLAMVVWAATKIPPTADGTYYHVLAGRLAGGHGYTWLWPDGAVTYAAHFPVGYPALLALAYGMFGAKPAVAMVVNAAVGAVGAWGVHDLLARSTTRHLALAGGLAFALHPALVPYTAALMTEGVTASLLVVATAFAARVPQATGRRCALASLTAAAMVLGVATLVRPQSLVLAPVLGWLAVRADAASLWQRARGALGVCAVALAICAPWTARNCARMDRCALVSVNGGWNLAIGTQTRDGSWQELIVPDACKGVFSEAAKDTCFGAAGLNAIATDPWRWLARAPRKVRVTFDYFGAGPWYLHAANAERFPYRAKVALAALEVLVSRALLLAALVSVRRLAGPRRTLREALTGLGLVACFFPEGASVAYLACAVAILLLGRRALADAPCVVPASAAVILATAATHAVFFGAGRYGLVVVPFVTALAFVRRGSWEATPTRARRFCSERRRRHGQLPPLAE